MIIDYDEDQNYCVVIGSTQSGKTIIFKTIKSDSVHRSLKLIPSAINVISNSNIFDRHNIFGLSEIFKATGIKLNNCLILKNDPLSAILKHMNDIIIKKDFFYITTMANIKQMLQSQINAEYYTLFYLQQNNIPFKFKDILAHPAGTINVNEMFKEEIKKYSLQVNERFIEKKDYEWSYEKYIQTIERGYQKQYNIPTKVNLNELLDYVHKYKEKYIKLYQLKI